MSRSWFIYASTIIFNNIKKQYNENDNLTISFGKLESILTQIPYSMFIVPWCLPKEINPSSDNLGEILSGDLTFESEYKVNDFDKFR